MIFNALTIKIYSLKHISIQITTQPHFTIEPKTRRVSLTCYYSCYWVSKHVESMHLQNMFDLLLCLLIEVYLYKGIECLKAMECTCKYIAVAVALELSNTCTHQQTCDKGYSKSIIVAVALEYKVYVV